MKRPRICAVIVNNDPEAVREVEPLVDLFEVRIDLIGDGWQELTKQLNRPWIACNRSPDEGGKGDRDEARRIEQLVKAVELGAEIIDIELATRNLEKAVTRIKNRAKCLLSFHDFEGTPSLDKMKEMVQRQLTAEADVCKVITTARGSLTIQVAAVKTAGIANEMVAKLKRQGYEAHQSVAKIPGKGLRYRIRVGRFTSSKEAHSLARRLKKDSYEAIIVNR